VTYDNVMNLLM